MVEGERTPWAICAGVLSLAFASCGGGGSSRNATGPLPSFDHVVVVVLENQNYDSIIGSSSMPFLNGLANANSIATNFYANTHPSIGNYFIMTTGEVISRDDQFSGTTSADNLVRQLVAVGKTWKVYAESLPSTGWTGGNVYPYIKHHNPFAYFSDVVATPQANNIVALTQLSSDLANGSLPHFAFIVPNNQNNMHDCPAGMSSCSLADKAANADTWLQANIGPLLV